MTQNFAKQTAAILTLSTMLVFQSLPQASAEFTLQDFPVSLKPQDPDYRITTVRPSHEPGILEYEVYAPHATYKIEGFLPLVKLLHEIKVIERVRRDTEGNSFLEGAGNSVAATGEGLKNLVIHPGQSAKGIGSAVGELGRSVGGIFRKKKSGEKTSFGEKILGSGEREIAKELGVDVYTSNPYLRSLLTEIAKAQLGGKGAVAVFKLLLPVAFVASVAMTAGSLSQAADQLVNDHSRGKLYRMNKEALMALGFSEKDVIKFLDATVLTPREQTYIRFYLEKLKYVSGFQQAFQYFIENHSPWEISKKLYELQIAADADKNQYQGLWIYPEGLAVQEKSGGTILIAAADDLARDDLGKNVLERAEKISEKTRFPVEIWSGGKIEPDFAAKAKQSHFGVKPWVFLLGDPKRVQEL